MTRGEPSVTIEELRAEYRQSGLGNLIYYQLFDLARLVANKQPLSSASEGQAVFVQSAHRPANPLRDDEPLDEVHELIQEFWIEGLVTLDRYKEMAAKHSRVVKRPEYWTRDKNGVRCTHWVLEVAHTRENLDEYRGFLYTWITKTAVRGNRVKNRTVIDNLWTRSKKILEEPPYDSTAPEKMPARKTYFFALSSRETQTPSDDDLERAARRVHQEGIRPARREEGASKTTGEAKRASVVYNTDELETLLEIVAGELSMGFTQQDLRKIFERLLPSWLPSSLEISEEGSAEVGLDEEVALRSVVREFMTSITDDELVLLRPAFDESIGFQDVADTLGVTRQTVRNRRIELLDKIMGLLDEPTQAETEVFLRFLGEAVVSPATNGDSDG
jgi:predicted DNA-binding protein (UPF0251 family)